MSLFSIDPQGKSKSLINLDISSAIAEMKRVPTYLKVGLLVALIFGIFYFLFLKSYFYMSEVNRIDDLDSKSYVIQKQLTKVQNILTSYNTVLQYYDANIKLIKLRQDANMDRLTIIMKHLKKTTNDPESYRILEEMMEESAKYTTKLNDLYISLQTSSAEDVSRLLYELDVEMSKMAEETKSLETKVFQQQK